MSEESNGSCTRGSQDTIHLSSVMGLIYFSFFLMTNLFQITVAPHLHNLVHPTIFGGDQAANEEDDVTD